jgi:hypothetical protein
VVETQVVFEVQIVFEVRVNEVRDVFENWECLEFHLVKQKKNDREELEDKKTLSYEK